MGAAESSLAGNYISDGVLGEGAFGVVHKVHHKDQPSIFYAAKQIQCSNNEELEDVMNEISALNQISHDNIVKCRETLCHQQEMFKAEIYIVMEFCGGGNLSDCLDRASPNKENLKWLLQLTSAVNYIHHIGLVHRDLKPDNVFLDMNGNIKIGDFGLSKNYSSIKYNNNNDMWQSYYMHDGCGTLNYMAPEVFADRFSEKADIFALGIIMYAIVERKYSQMFGRKFYGVFIENSGIKLPLGLFMHRQQNTASIIFEKTPRNMACIICPTLLYDQKQRPTALHLMQQLEKL